MADVNYISHPNGEFEIENYNRAKFFASFLPGIAGEKGIPIWAFYINRGQCLAGFGIRDKDGAIQEYVPADKAAWYTSWRGFRTFLKINQTGGPVFYEPFRTLNDIKGAVRQKLTITPADLTISEIHEGLGLEVKITYFTLPEQKIGGLFRKTEFRNTGSQSLQIEALDGLAAIMPSGYTNILAKNMGATIRAWMKVDLINGVPYYKLKCRPDDVTEFVPINSGNFHFGYFVDNGKIKQLKSIYDPAVIFGDGADFQPVRFREPDFHYPQDQSRENSLPAAFSYLKLELPAGESTFFYGVYGYSPSAETLAEFLAGIDGDFYQKKWDLNRSLVKVVSDYAFTNSGDSQFDRYVGQCFLDNAIRGGIPKTLAGENTPNAKVFWLYSRKHGDLERDYNDFQLSPTYFSQGNGNFRDINQNRRNDIWFNTDVNDQALHYFWNLIQLDGYNPLVVKGLSYILADFSSIENWVSQNNLDINIGKIRELTSKPFTPGELQGLLSEGINLSPELGNQLFGLIIVNSREIASADYGDGYWIDHWIYNLDLFDSYCSIFPERILNACVGRHDYTFYDSWVLPVPSGQRFQLIRGEVRQRDCIRIDQNKKVLLGKRQENRYQLRTFYGTGQVYQTNLLIKMLSLAVNKLASFDPYLAGLEMDAGKPGWCDALNGLPEILGSSVVEVFALNRLLQQIMTILDKVSANEVLAVPIEISEFINGLAELLNMELKEKTDFYHFWEAAHQLRDEFLNKTRLGITGNETPLTPSQLSSFISRSQKLVETALQRAYRPELGLYHTYFYYRVTRWRTIADNNYLEDYNEGVNMVWPEEFQQYTLPEFLEGQVNALRITGDRKKAKRLYQAVRDSELYDRKLKMYKSSSDLTKAPDEIGRIKVFPRGWLENESIFLHMEYKYLLEIFRSGLYEEFFTELPVLLTCYHQPEVYGRNPLENSSFIVSSSNPRAELHGKGFVARLSGSNTELVNIWLYMSFGPAPFSVTDTGELELEFKPVLTEKYFNPEASEVTVSRRNGELFEYQLPSGSYAAKFLGKVLVVYQNPTGKATFGPGAAKIVKMTLVLQNGEEISFTGAKINGDWARKVRDGAVQRINLFME